MKTRWHSAQIKPRVEKKYLCFVGYSVSTETKERSFKTLGLDYVGIEYSKKHGWLVGRLFGGISGGCNLKIEEVICWANFEEAPPCAVKEEKHSRWPFNDAA